MFAFFQHDGSELRNYERYVSVVVEYFIISDTYDVTINNSSLKYVPCNEVSFQKHQDLVDDTMKTNIDFHCIKFFDDTKIKNGYAERDSIFVSTNFLACDPKKQKCADDLDDKLKEIYVQTVFFDTYLDSYNYTNPIQYYPKYDTQQINSSFLKRSYFRFSTNVYISENGWILEDEKSFFYTKLDNIKFDINPAEDILKGNMYWITFESPRLRKVVKRHYMKVQELLAKIGGLVKGLTIVIQIITYHYCMFSYKLNLQNIFVNVINSKLKNADCKIEDVLKEENSKTVVDKKYPHKQNTKITKSNKNKASSLNNDKDNEIKINDVIKDKIQYDKFDSSKDSIRPKIDNYMKNFAGLNNNTKDMLSDTKDLGYFRYLLDHIICKNRGETLLKYKLMDNLYSNTFSITKLLELITEKSKIEKLS